MLEIFIFKLQVDVSFCIEDYIDVLSLKLKGHFHILEATFQMKPYLLDFNYAFHSLNY